MFEPLNSNDGPLPRPTGDGLPPDAAGGEGAGVEDVRPEDSRDGGMEGEGGDRDQDSGGMDGEG